MQDAMDLLFSYQASFEVGDFPFNQFRLMVLEPVLVLELDRYNPFIPFITDVGGYYGSFTGSQT